MRGLVAVSILASVVAAHSADWSGFQGPNRDGHSPDSGLLKEWPEAGPPLLWDVDNIGAGWSSMAVVDGLIYTTGNARGKQMLICLDLDGREKWRAVQGPQCSHKKYGGARSTPTIDGDRVYVTGGDGLVTCHRTRDGRILWKRDMKSELGGKVGGWKYAESVLILDNLAVVTPGGRNAIVALDKMTGRDVWKSGVSGTAGYSSCMTITLGGHTVIVNGTQSGLMVVDAGTGKLIYRNEFASPNTANVPTPAFENGLLFWGVGYGKGSICFDVDCRAGKWSFKEIWRNDDLRCHPGNYVVVRGRVYGKGKGGLVCVDLKTGETQWQERVRGGQVCWADGMLYSFSDSGGQISLIDPGASTSRTRGTFRVAGTGSSWSHPVIIGGRMLLRYDTNLYCYDVKAR